MSAVPDSGVVAGRPAGSLAYADVAARDHFFDVMESLAVIQTKRIARELILKETLDRRQIELLLSPLKQIQNVAVVIGAEE